MNKIYAITDYKENFGSKWEAEPYRSGFDKRTLFEAFQNHGYRLEYLKAAEVSLSDDWTGRNVIYTSSEEHGYHYKDFLEDCILSLQLAGANLIPGYSFLRANNNKVFMEQLREQRLGKRLSGIKSYTFGTLEELNNEIEKGAIDFPSVIKEAAGAMSRGVYLAKSKDELIRYAKKISKTASPGVQLKEKVRVKKHSGYKPESFYQKKFIVQPFVPGLSNDWKILIFGDHFYVFERPVRKNDFRASGSGAESYLYGSETSFPEDLFNFCNQIYQRLNVPNLSLDIAFSKYFYLLEFQAVYFGTVGQYKSDILFIKNENNKYESISNTFTQEEEYVYGIVHYLENCDQNKT